MSGNFRTGSFKDFNLKFWFSDGAIKLGIIDGM